MVREMEVSRLEKSSKFPRKWKAKDWKKMKNGRKEIGPGVQYLIAVTKHTEAKKLQKMYQKLSQSWGIQVARLKEYMKCTAK